jgi:hypothetical protein
MTDEHRFAKPARREHRYEDELWNVSLLPIEHSSGPATAKQPEQDAKRLENLDERRSRNISAGASRLRLRAETISASFESQLEAVGW